jgi:hypothetical protein
LLGLASRTDTLTALKIIIQLNYWSAGRCFRIKGKIIKLDRHSFISPLTQNQKKECVMSILQGKKGVCNQSFTKFVVVGMVFIISLAFIMAKRTISNASTTRSATSTQMAFFAYWSVDNGFSSSVILSNASNIQLTVNPVLYNLSGKPLPVKPIFLAPGQQLAYSITDWIAENAVSDTFNQGNLILNYEAPDASNLGAQVTVTNLDSSLSFDMRNEMPMSFKSSFLEGMWWRPDEGSRYDLVLSNMKNHSASVILNFPYEKGTPADSALVIKLAPHETQVINLAEKKIPVIGIAKAGKAGGISINHTAEPGAVLAYGMLSNKQTGFCSHFTFEDPAISKSQTLAATHLLIGEPDIDGFPEQTSFTSVALLRNTTDQPIDVKPIVSFMQKNEARSLNLALRHLLPQQVAAMDIGAELKRAGISGPFVGAGLTLQSSGKPGNLQAHLSSYDQTHNHVFDVPMKDPAVTMNRFNGSYPFNLEGEARSVIHVRNTTDEKALFTIQFDYEGGSYCLPIQALAPQQEAAIDVRQLRDRQTADSIGRVLPKELIRGQAIWIEHGAQALTGRAENFNVVKAVASSYSCPLGCCPAGDNRVYMTPSSTDGGVGSTALIQLLLIRRQDCNGVEYGPYSVATQASWLSDHPGVVSLVSISSSGCLVNCATAGYANIHADFSGACVELDPGGETCSQFTCMLPADCPMTVVDVSIEPVLGVGKNATIDIPITVTPAAIITLTLTTTSGTGSAKFASNNSTTRTINQSGNVTITGITESSTADNIHLEAKMGNTVLDSDNFSVVWVTLSFKSAMNDSVSMDNSARAEYITCSGQTMGQLGMRFNTGECGSMWSANVEVIGMVTPSNYLGSVRLEREIVTKRTYDNMTLLAPVVNNMADNSPNNFRDDNPQSGNSNGKVYDVDGPGLATGSSVPLNGIIRRRQNFRQWATIDGVTVNDPRIRASADFPWFYRLSVIKTAGGDQLQSDLSGDNIVGTGTTNITWNFQ